MVSNSIDSLRNLSLPKHRRVARAILGYIRKNNLRPGDCMPGERKMAEILGVSHITVAKGLSALTEKGLLVRQVGSGTFIADTQSAQEMISTVRFGLVTRYTESDQYNAGLKLGMEKGLKNYNAELVALYQNHDAYLENMHKYDLTGIAVISPTSSSIKELDYIRNMAPLVIIGVQYENFSDITYGCDDEDACYQEVKYLISLGHRKIGCLCVPNHSTIALRMRGYLKGMFEAGLPVHPDWLPQAEEYTGTGVNQYLAKHIPALLKASHRPTAFVCPTPSLLLTAYNAAETVGLKIPDDISVIGVDELSVGEYVSVPPTIMYQPLEEIGYAAAKHLWAAFNNMNHEGPHLFKAKFAERSSCKTILR